ncbi:MAG: metallophosphoesterase [Myxococcales bacterium]|nr:metallophosphoesterase [Myxococcales bacterium]
MTRRPPRVAPLLLLGALAHAPAHAVERGPHPQLDATGAALVWRGDTPARVLLDGAVTRVVEAPPPGPDGRVVVPLGPLPPATRVHYTVETAGRRIPGRFWTPPAPRAPFTFVAYGDSRADHRVHQALAARIAEVDPDLVLHTGDLVTRGERDDEWAAFFAATEAIWSRAPIWPVMGNHDLDAGTARALLRHFALPGKNAYYALTWGNVRLLAVDTEVAMIDDVPDAAQTAWLIAEVEAAAADRDIDHVVAFLHKGPHSTHPARAGNVGLRPLLHRLHAAGLDLVISGHDHFYERGQTADGLDYIVLGAGGAPLYPTTGPAEHPDHRVFVARSIYSFARFRVRGPRIEGCGVDLSGAPFDCFTIGTGKHP